MKTQGRLQRINPFKEIDGKEYNKKHYNKQKELLEKFSKEIQQGNKYLGEFSNINDETGLKRAYNNRTDLGLYHHPENKTLYIEGTKDFPRDILDDTLIPFLWFIGQSGIRPQTTSSETTLIMLIQSSVIPWVQQQR